METIIAILFYMGISFFGSTSASQTELNGVQSTNPNQTNSTQIRTDNSGSGNGNIVINDNDKDN